MGLAWGVMEDGRQLTLKGAHLQPMANTQNQSLGPNRIKPKTCRSRPGRLLRTQALMMIGLNPGPRARTVKPGPRHLRTRPDPGQNRLGPHKGPSGGLRVQQNRSAVPTDPKKPSGCEIGLIIIIKGHSLRRACLNRINRINKI